MSEFINNFWRFFCGSSCVWPEDERDPAIWAAQGSLVVAPQINKFASLQFSLSAEQKWEAVMIGFAGTVASLRKSELIDENKLKELSALAGDRELFIRDCRFEEKA